VRVRERDAKESKLSEFVGAIVPSGAGRVRWAFSAAPWRPALAYLCFRSRGL